jgi:hypothetical protein
MMGDVSLLTVFSGQPAAAIKREADSLGGPDPSMDDEQVGAGRRDRAQQFADGGDLFVAALGRARQLVTARRLDRAELPQVAADAGLRGEESEVFERSDKRGLCLGRTVRQEIADRFAPLALFFRGRWHGVNLNNYAHNINFMRIMSQHKRAHFLCPDTVHCAAFGALERYCGLT